MKIPRGWQNDAKGYEPKFTPLFLSQSDNNAITVLYVCYTSRILVVLLVHLLSICFNLVSCLPLLSSLSMN